MKPDEQTFFTPEITEQTIKSRIYGEMGRTQPEAQPELVQSCRLNQEINVSVQAAILNQQRDAAAIRTAIDAAEARADIGIEVTPMATVPAPLRGLARMIGKAILRLSAFITVRQRSFNHYVINALRLSANAVEQTIRTQTAAMEAVRRGILREVTGRQVKMDEKLERQEHAIQDQVTMVRQELAAREALMNEKLVRQERAVQDLIYLKTSMALLERRVTALLDEAGRRLPVSAPFDRAQLETMAAEGGRGLDAFYVALEDRFRGSREQILERLQGYLPQVRQAVERTDGAMALDIGCGRGEWLELLYREGIQARGVDTNRLMIDQCRERCLEVIHEDALSYLRTLPDGAIGVVTGFHIIEHLPFDVLIKLMDETLRVLKPGGMFLFETPNPNNVLVGSCNFYLDPTHLRPLPSLVMRFIAESRGFAEVEIIDLNPSTATPIAEETEVARRFNEHFYGAMEYAVIGRKGRA